MRRLVVSSFLVLGAFWSLQCLPPPELEPDAGTSPDGGGPAADASEPDRDRGADGGNEAPPDSGVDGGRFDAGPVLHKIGLHVSSGGRNGFGNFLERCAAAGKPVPVLFSVDQDLWADAQRHSPKTTVVFRHQPGGDDGPSDLYQGGLANARASAHRWMARVMPKWKLNRAHFYAPLNEQDPGTLDGYVWLDVFTQECLKIADQNGFKLALYAFSTGNPRDDADIFDGGTTLEQKWSVLLPSMRAAKAGGHVLLLHEYGLDRETLEASAPNLALRYRRSMSFLARHDADPPLIISEAGAGVGGVQPNLSAWLKDIAWYDSEVRKDPRVIGFCLYQVGGAENISSAFGPLADMIERTP